MKNKWIWIVLIVIAIIVVLGVAVMPFVHSYVYTQNGAAGFDNDWQGHHMFGSFGRHGFGGMGMMRFGFFPFGFGMMFLMLFFRLIPWALLGLAVWGVYQLGKRAGSKQQPLPASQPETPAPTTETK